MLLDMQACAQIWLLPQVQALLITSALPTVTMMFEGAAGSVAASKRSEVQLSMVSSTIQTMHSPNAPCTLPAQDMS